MNFPHKTRQLFFAILLASANAAAISTEKASSDAAALETPAQVAQRAAAQSTKAQARVAIVTGASQNLGRGFAEALARDGVNVVVHYYQEDSRVHAETTAKLIRAAGAEAEIFEADLTKSGSAKRVFDFAIKEFGRVDILVNNAGWIVKKPVADISEAEWDRSFAINAKAPFFLMQQAATRMQDNGRVVNIGSSLQGSFTANYSAYAAAKVTLDQTTRAFVREVGQRGITANIVAPGPIDTPFFWAQENEQSGAFAARLSVQKRLGKIDDIVPVVRFLTSPDARWVNGQTIFVNGGYLAR